MKLAIAMLVLVALLPAIAHGGDDIRDKVRKPTGRLPTTVIEPDRAVFGIPFGSTEDQVIRDHGDPTGYVRLNGTQTAMLYGRSIALLFDGGRLVGLRLRNAILDWDLVRLMPPLSKFDGIEWRLDNGIKAEDTLPSVRAVLGEKLLKSTHHRFYYVTTKARVELDFAHFTTRGDSEDAYALDSIYIRLR